MDFYKRSSKAVPDEVENFLKRFLADERGNNKRTKNGKYHGYRFNRFVGSSIETLNRQGTMKIAVEAYEPLNLQHIYVSEQGQNFCIVRPSVFRTCKETFIEGSTTNCLGNCIYHITGKESRDGIVSYDILKIIQRAEEITGFKLIQLERFNSKAMFTKLKNKKRKLRGKLPAELD